MISFTPPMECATVEKLPDSSEWIYELKLDGYRAQGIHDRGVKLLSKNGKDLGKKFPSILKALRDALCEGTAVDGEIAVLQNAGPDNRVVFYVFDVLFHEGKNVKPLPLYDRLSILEAAFVPSEHAQLCTNFALPAEKFIAAVKKLGGEAVVAKRLNCCYESGRRSGAWRKVSLNFGQ